jgi:hypothetical protein
VLAVYRVAFAALVAAAFVTAPGPALSAESCKGDLCFQKKARTGCWKPEVWDMLHKVAARVGPLEIASGCEGHHARGSYHYRGMAADFRAVKRSEASVVAVLRSMPEVGGIGTYGNGLIHADLRAKKFAWHGFRKSRFASARAEVVRQQLSSATASAESW